MTTKLTSWAIAQLAQTLDERAGLAYANSRVLRAKQDDGGLDGSGMYELGHEEGEHMAYRVAAERLHDLSRVLSDDS